MGNISKTFIILIGVISLLGCTDSIKRGREDNVQAALAVIGQKDSGTAQLQKSLYLLADEEMEKEAVGAMLKRYDGAVQYNPDPDNPESRRYLDDMATFVLAKAVFDGVLTRDQFLDPQFDLSKFEADYKGLIAGIVNSNGELIKAGVISSEADGVESLLHLLYLQRVIEDAPVEFPLQMLLSYQGEKANPVIITTSLRLLSGGYVTPDQFAYVIKNMDRGKAENFVAGLTKEEQFQTLLTIYPQLQNLSVR